jgi:hypothetical protein
LNEPAVQNRIFDFAGSRGHPMRLTLNFHSVVDAKAEYVKF